MINKSDFKEGELQQDIQKLESFHNDPNNLHQEIVTYFTEFDEDKSGSLDRKELRHFLTLFFKNYHVHLPITDEFVDGVFREIDTSHDNKIQPEELEAFSKKFVDQLLNTMKAAKWTLVNWKIDSRFKKSKCYWPNTSILFLKYTNF